MRQAPLVAAGCIMVAFLAGVAALAPVIAPYAPQAITGDALESPSRSHLLGTNDAGADNFSRLVWGSRTALLVALTATAIVLTIGITVGLVAGLRGGLVDSALMRILDIFLAVPMLPLFMFIAAFAGPSRKLTIVLIGVTAWPQTARLVRSQTLSLRTRGFIDSARGFGARPVYVIRRHLVPALGPVIAANLVFVAGLAVGLESALAFLGLGDPVAVSWGNEISRALFNQQIRLGNLWLWWLLPPGLALTVAVLGLTLIGVGLEPRFNPRWERVR